MLVTHRKIGILASAVLPAITQNGVGEEVMPVVILNNIPAFLGAY
jgi:hypothetical protein